MLNYSGTLPGNGRPKKKKKSSNSHGNGITRAIDDVFNKISGAQAAQYAFHPEKQAGSLAELIEKQAAQQQAAAQKASGLSALVNPYQSLQDQLFSAVNGVQAQTTPLDQLRQMATSQVSAQYDPMIQALQGEISAKANRGEKSQKQAREMYGDLSSDFLSQLPDLTAQYKAEDDATNARYDQAQQQMQGEYDKQAADQDAVLKRLGVQAAAPDASQQSKDDQAYFQNQAELDQQQALTSQDQEQNSSLDYQRSLGNNAKMAGENTAEDIRSQLEDYMTQASGQLSGLRAQKSSGIEALLSQMQAQDQQNAESTRQKEIDNLMQMFNFQLSAQKAGDSAMQDSAASSAFKGTSGLPGAQNYLAEQYPNQPIMASNLMGMINDVLSNKAVTQGKFVLDPGDPSLGHAPKYSDVGQEYMQDLLRREFEQKGGRYSKGDINATMAALEAYLGKLR